MPLFSLARLLATLLLLTAAACAQPPTRAEVIATARRFAEFTWTAEPRHYLHGLDADGIFVATPGAASATGAQPGWWIIGQTNTGIPYKWGGFDSLQSFARGLAKGKAAGDLYSTEKRRRADAAVSSEAVGLDCSGFISRCWGLSRKYGTATLPQLCYPVPRVTDLLPGDILNVAGGHVILFAEWRDSTKTAALCYEAEPFSKVRATEFHPADLIASGFKAWRYRALRD